MEISSEVKFQRNLGKYILPSYGPRDSVEISFASEFYLVLPWVGNFIPT